MATNLLDFGSLFGADDSGMSEYLTPAQQSAMNTQALMQAASALLQASGPSTQRISFGQALGGAMQAGAKGYSDAQQNAMNQVLLKQRMDDAKLQRLRTQRELDMQKRLQELLLGTGGTTAPTAQAPQPGVELPAAGETITAPQSLLIPGLPVGPTVDRASLIGQQMPEGIAPPSLPAVTATAKPKTQQDILAKLSPEQRLLVAMNPTAMLPKVFEESMKQESFDTITGQDAVDLGLDARGRYQINNRTNQITTLQAPGEEYKIVTGADAVKLGLPAVGNYQVNTKTNQATLVGTAEGPFGGGTTGAAYNILLTEDPSSAKYALAYRELSKPVPTEQVQPDGSLKTVYTQPAPIPASFAKPSYKGRMPTPSATPATVVQPGGVTTAPVPSRAAPVAAPLPAVSPTAGATAAPLPAGVKSTPMAPQPAEIKDARKAVNAGVDFVAALDKLENMVRSQGMQIGGLGKVGAAQEVVYEDLLTKIRLAAELGVLNKEDLPRIQAQLGSPTALSTYIKGLGGPDAFYSQIQELKNKTVEETTRMNLQFGQPIMNLPQTFGATKPAPARPQTPPAIQNLLNKYPPRKQ
jgi:hypothetical protein